MPYILQVSSKVLTMSWTSDGMFLALGCFDGSVSIRDKAGTEKHKIDVGTSPCWSVAWSPQDQNVLAVGSLDGQLRFYTPTGNQKYKERQLEGDPLSLSYFNNEYLLIGGTDK